MQQSTAALPESASRWRGAARPVADAFGAPFAAPEVAGVLERLASATDDESVLDAVLHHAGELAGVDAAAFVRGGDDVVAAVGRVVRPDAYVRAVLGGGHRSGDDGGCPPQAWAEAVDGQGGALAGRLVVVHRQRGGLDRAGRSSLRSLALLLGLGLHGLAGRERALRAELPESLTGLPGRPELLAQIDRALARPHRDGHRLAVLFVDIDRFKTVNDSLGHDAGDELLSLVGARLRACIRPEDSAAHLEGDEFALLLLHQADPVVVAGVADRVRAALCEPYRLRRSAAGAEVGRDVHLDASVGVALATSAGTSSQELLHNADLAMARAKADGRARVVFYEPGMHEAAVARLEMEAALRRALADGELSVHYQPIHRLSDGTMKSVEALVRWHHPTLGSVPPSVFVPVAEHTDLIVPIGSWVLTTACAQVAGWRRGGLAPDLTVNVNLSARQLRRDDISQVVTDALVGSGLPAEALVLEVTESVLVDDLPAASLQLEALRSLGVRIAIDDFGTGYATLGYLQQLPADILKIDKSFIDDLALGPERSALARAVVKLGRTLGLCTTAEGIEEAEQLDILRGLGCDDGQGYLFSKPLAAAALERRLHQHVAGTVASR